METISHILDKAFRQAIRQAFDIDSDPMIALSGNEKFGDYQANAAMGLAKELSKRGEKANPRAVAERILQNLQLGDLASEVTIAGPGFINVRLSPAWLAGQLQGLVGDQRAGAAKVSSPQTVVVDYSGPNIAKELHVGHLRSTIIGDSVARVLDFQGHRVVRQNHIGDWGTQFGKIILALWYIAMAKEKRGDLPELMNMAGRLGQLRKEEKQSGDKLRDLPKNASPAERQELEQKLAASKAAMAELLTVLRDRHQEDIDADPAGDRVFHPFIKKYRPDLDELLPIYQMVSLFDELESANQLMIRRGETVRSLASLPRLLTSMLQSGEPEDRQEVDAWWKVREATLNHCQEIYDRLGVLLTRLDEYGESRYNPLLPRIVSDLLAMGLAQESQGAIAVFIDGPEKPPLIIQKAGGEGYLYGTTDLAAIWYRAQGICAQRIIYLVDARQAGHFNQVFATAKKAGWANDVSLEHAAFGTMLGEDGRPFKTRSGDTVKLSDLLDEAVERAMKIVTDKNPELPDTQRQEIAQAVGIGAIKYADLSKDRTSDYVFSWDKMLSLDGNTAPYLQYAHARVKSIFRRAAERGIRFDPQSARIALESPFELALAKQILRLPEVLSTVSRELKPHHLCAYLYELATRYSGFFENCPVLQSEEPLRSSRLALCDLTARTLELGLELLGIGHPEQM